MTTAPERPRWSPRQQCALVVTEARQRPSDDQVMRPSDEQVMEAPQQPNYDQATTRPLVLILAVGARLMEGGLCPAYWKGVTAPPNGRWTRPRGMERRFGLP